MSQNIETVDVLLVGAGIMSATLGVLLKELDPALSLRIVEMSDSCAAESSNPWNNAGTGHAGLCEMNYTPQAADGTVNVSKAIQINSQFEVSKQFWGHLVATGVFGAPQDFINSVPHMCFVRGEKDVAFLRTRHAGMSAHHAFATMEYSEDRARMESWIPLTMAGRPSEEKLAVTRVAQGTDVNFGALTMQLLAYLERSGEVTINYKQRVTGLARTDKGWRVSMRDTVSGATRVVEARFVFLGGGGGALPLLQMSGIPEGRGFGGFPVSGLWLRCDKPAVVERHQAKVYSRAEVGAPPMSVPHLDTRVVDGKKSLLFGPFAGFSTKFLKKGSYLDLLLSVRPDNIGPMLAAGRDNMDLTRYLVREVMQSDEDRMTALRRLYPEAKAEDWRLEIAGQRVQIIKRDAQKGGVLQFGTEVVSASDGSIAALLGASPGASVSVPIMLELIERCFADRMPMWRTRIEAIFPAREKALQTNAALYREVSDLSAKRLGLLV